MSKEVHSKVSENTKSIHYATTVFLKLKSAVCILIKLKLNSTDIEPFREITLVVR